MQIGVAVMEFTHLCAQSGIRMPVELTMLGKTLLNLDEIGQILDPAFERRAGLGRGHFARVHFCVKPGTPPPDGPPGRARCVDEVWPVSGLLDLDEVGLSPDSR